MAELGTLVLGAEFPEIADIHMQAVGKVWGCRHVWAQPCMDIVERIRR
jgi:hypothetical protein